MGKKYNRQVVAILCSIVILVLVFSIELPMLVYPQTVATILSE